MTPDDLTPDAFARLSALEQSQELLRRATFLDARSRARHAAALDRQQAKLDDHAARTVALETLLTRQQQQQALLHSLMEDTHTRMAQNEEMLGKVQLTLDAALEMLRHRNGR